MSEKAVEDTVEEGAAATSLIELDIDRGVLGFSRFFEITPTAMRITGKPSLERCAEMAGFLHIAEKSLSWAVGDFVLWTESAYGEEASQVIDSEFFSPATLRVYAWVAAKIAPERRVPELPFSAHQEVASLVPEQQTLWLKRALEGDDGAVWSTSRLKREIKQSTTGTPLVTEKYEVIVACESENDQDACLRQLENLGRTQCRKSTRNS